MVNNKIKTSVKALYEKGISLTAIAKKHNIEKKEIVSILREFGFNTRLWNKWSEEEKALVESLSEYLTIDEIAGMLNRTTDSVNEKMKELGLSSVRRWTEKDEEFLMDYWGVMQIEAIANTLNRSTRAIKEKAMTLNLLSAKNGAGFFKINDIATITGLSPYKIRSFAKKGLNIKTNYITRNSKFDYIDMPDLIDFFEKNQNLYSAADFELSYFNGGPMWLKSKKIEDARTRKKQHQSWTMQERKTVKQMFFNGIKISQIAKVMNRTESAIYHVCRQ